MKLKQALSLRQAFHQIGRSAVRDRPDDRLAGRARLAALILQQSEGGYVLFCSGGMDCDCCEYGGRTALLPASVAYVNREIEQLYDDAEGPVHWELARPSELPGIEPWSRDRALEAYEDGHPSRVRYSGGGLEPVELYD